MAGSEPDSPLELEPLDGLDEFRTDWSNLAQAARNPFATPEWSELWLAHIGGDSRVLLFGGRRADGSLAAILPLVVSRRGHLRRARFLGSGPASALGPIAGAADQTRAAQLFREALAATRQSWDIFLGDHLPGTGWAERVGGTLVARKGSPAIRRRWETWDEYLASRSSNFRQELRRKERRLQERGLAFREVSHQSELDDGLDVLFELHRARWGAGASVWFAGQEAFQRAFARRALERGWLRLRFLELDGRPVAASHNFRFADVEWSYQFGRDPSTNGASIGLLMSAHAVRRSFEEGADEFRLGPGAQPFKLRFATDDPGLETIGVASGLRGRAALMVAKRRGR